jgi:hypothetical protein
MSDDQECFLCAGTGMVEIVPAGQHVPDSFGCPVCIERELEEEIERLTSLLREKSNDN